MAKLDPAKQVQAVPTPWGPSISSAKNQADDQAIRRKLILRFNELLKRLGVNALHVRRRMTAHALMAAGYAQRVWHYNCWSVKVGAWKGKWYDKATNELIQGGKVHLPNEGWRAYDSWAAALADYPIETMARYAESKKLLHSIAASDSDFFAQMGEDGYYTADPFEWVDGIAPAVPGFLARANKFTAVLTSATPEEKREAIDWVNEELGLSGGGGGGGDEPAVNPGAAAGGVFLLIAIPAFILALKDR